MKISRFITPIIILFGAALLLYVSVKATLSSFTHDESFSYLNYCHETFMQIISYSNWYTNNHILNSLLMKYSEKLFGNTEIALRLPNLILLIIYMIYSYLLFKDKNQVLALAMFVLLLTNNLLIDLFGMARGYGMSIGFMFMALYHFITYLKDNKKLNMHLFHFAALLASLSNFTLLVFYVAMLMSYNIFLFIKTYCLSNQKIRFFRNNKIHIIPLFFSIIVLYEPVRRALTYGKFDFGGKNGFYADTVAHLVMNTLSFSVNNEITLIFFMVFFTVIVFGSLFFILRNTYQENKVFVNEYKGLIVTNFLLITISVIFIAQHHILGTDYPVSRFSVFLFPIFMAHFGFFIDYLFSLGLKKTILIAISCYAIISITLFIQKVDLYACAEWAYDKQTKNMMLTLESYHKSSMDKAQQIEVGCDWLFEPTMNYYRIAKGYNWLLPVQRDNVSNNNHFNYIFNKNIHKFDSGGYEIIVEYKDIKTLLIKSN